MKIQTLELLRQANVYLSDRYTGNPDNGLGLVGLILSKCLSHETYSSSPINALRFASTGGNGVHFGLIEDENGVSNNSPVVMTVPMYLGKTGEHPECNFIVGKNLTQFLEFGLHLGYFAMEQLSYDLEGSLRDRRIEQKIGPKKYIETSLSLQPQSYTLTEFENLQETYKPTLQYAAKGNIEYPPGFFDDF